MSTKPTYVSASGTIGEIPLTARVQRWASDYVTMGYLFFETLFAPMLDPSAFADPSRSSLTRGSGGAGRSGGSGPSSGGGGGWPRGGGGGGGSGGHGGGGRGGGGGGGGGFMSMGDLQGGGSESARFGKGPS